MPLFLCLDFFETLTCSGNSRRPYFELVLGIGMKSPERSEDLQWIARPEGEHPIFYFFTDCCDGAGIRTCYSCRYTLFTRRDMVVRIS